MRLLCVLSLLLLTISTAATGQTKSPMALFPATEIEWKDGPPSLPKGAKMVVLEGDPTQPGMFTMRLRFPDGFQVFPHWHTQTEHVTIVAGTLHLGMFSSCTVRGPGPSPTSTQQTTRGLRTRDEPDLRRDAESANRASLVHRHRLARTFRHAPNGHASDPSGGRRSPACMHRLDAGLHAA